MNRPAFSPWGRLAALGLVVGLCALVRADTVPSTSQLPQKVEEIDKAVAALQKGQLDAAYQHLVDATKKNPDLPPARFMLAKILSGVQNMGAVARSTLEQAAAENPDHPVVYLQNAEIGLNDARYSDVVLNCEKALLLSRANRWSAEQKRKYNTDAHIYLSAVAELRKHWSDAATHLTALLEAQPNDVKLRARLAQAFFFQDKPDDAFKELEKAAKVKDPTMLDTAEVIMAKLWTAKGDYPKAREWLNKAAKQGANNVRVKLAFADWLLQQNQVDEADIHVKDAVKLEPKNTEVMRLQGLVARIKKDLKTAETTFQQILVQAPGDQFATNHLALCLADSKDESQRAKSIPHADLNVRANQKSAEAWATLGYCYFRLKDSAKAMNALQVAASGGQITSDTGYFLAMMFVDKDKYEDAKTLLEGSLQAKGLMVYREDAKKLLEEVKKKLPPESKDKDKDKAGKDKAKSNP
jgi:uncharacterized protein HemY